MRITILINLLLCCELVAAQKNSHDAIIKISANRIEQQVIGWRHDIHQNPELGNHETRTSTHSAAANSTAANSGPAIA